MKAVVYKGPRNVAVEEVEDARIEWPTDALVRITSSAICGSDLHMYEGRTDVGPGLVFGHEPMGVIEEVGSAVVLMKPGDRVVMPFNVSCGYCLNCSRGFPNACLTLNPQQAGAAYGYADMGPYKGGQAEYLRVPYADYNCLKLPGKPGDDMEDDFVLLADVFPTGFHAAQLAKVQTGATVAIFGDGPVGLMAAMSSALLGASEIYVAGRVPERLEKAKEVGAIPINIDKGDPVEQIIEMRRSNKTLQEAMRPGEEKMIGVMCGIDAVGYQAADWEHPSEEHPARVLDDLIRLVNPTGSIGVIGVYLHSDPGGHTDQAKHGQVPMWFGKLWEKGITIGTGQAPVKNYNVFLRDLIMAGKARPSFIVSKRMPLDQAPEAYDKFDKREPGYTKVVLKPYI